MINSLKEGVMSVVNTVVVPIARNVKDIKQTKKYDDQKEENGGMKGHRIEDCYIKIKKRKKNKWKRLLIG